MTEMNLSMKQKQIHRHGKSICGYLRGTGLGEDKLEFLISRYKLLYIGHISKKVLLYSTENDIQYPVINHNIRLVQK